MNSVGKSLKTDRLLLWIIAEQYPGTGFWTAISGHEWDHITNTHFTPFSWGL